MRRAFLPVLMISLILMSGCSSAAEIEERFDARRAELVAAEQISFAADVHADLGENVFDCTLDCVSGGGDTVLTVKEPELIAGITIRQSGKDTSMEYDGLQLYVGKTGGDLAPIEAVPILTDALLNGFATDYYSEETEDGSGLVVVKIYIDESSYAMLWMDSQSMDPVHGQIVVGEQAVLDVEIKDFSAQ